MESNIAYDAQNIISAELDLTNIIWDGVKQKIANNKPRDGNHISGMYYYCPRKEALKDIDRLAGREIKTRVTEPAGQVAMDYGTAIHKVGQEYLRHTFLSAWHCRKCKGQIKTDSPPTKTVLSECCGATLFFSEPECTIQDGDMIGHSDGVQKLAVFPAKNILEIKSMAEHVWCNVEKPREQDIYQASLYAEAQGLDYVLYVYMNRNADTRSPSGFFKVFKGTRDAEILPDALKKLRLVREWRELPDTEKDAYHLPLRLGRCPNKSSYGAKYCEYKQECFCK